VLLDDVRTAVGEFSKQLELTESRIDDKMMSMRQMVNKQISKVNADLKTQKGLLSQGVVVDERAAPEQALAELEGARVRLEELKQTTITLQGYQVLFGMEAYSFQVRQGWHRRKRASAALTLVRGRRFCQRRRTCWRGASQCGPSWPSGPR
jgi:hypothetical protein